MSIRTECIIFTLGELAGEVAQCTEAELAALRTWAEFSLEEKLRAVAIAALDAERARRDRRA